MSFLVVYVIHPSKPEASVITADLLHVHLIACANYFPIESTYWWDGRLTHSEEIVTLYKTIPENYESIKKLIESKHKYTVPCIMKFVTVEANVSYENWVQTQCIPVPGL